MSKEHILPLSLGGCNKLCIEVNSEINKILGSKIDGILANDYLISCLRRRHNLRGHSNSAPVTKFKKVKVIGTNLPVQITHEINSKRIYDLRNRRYLTDAEYSGLQFSITIPFDKHIRSLFVTKVAIAAGYFIYGDEFLHYTDHESLRQYMSFAIHRNENLVNDLNLRFIDQFTTNADKRTIQLKDYFTLISKLLNCSSVQFILCSEHFLVNVAIAGKYIGTVNFKANAKQISNSGIYSGGHVLAIQNGILKRASFNHFENSIIAKYGK